MKLSCDSMYPKRPNDKAVYQRTQATGCKTDKKFFHERFLTHCFVISATPEGEIREIVQRRGMAGYFKEVLGAPVDKRKNLEILLAKYNLNPSRCFFFGDAESDYLAANICGVEFFGILQGEDAPLLQARPGVRWTKNFIDFEEKFGLVS